MLQIPTSTVSQIMSTVSQLFSDFGGLITLAIGVLLFFSIVEWFLHLGGKTKGGEIDNVRIDE